MQVKKWIRLAAAAATVISAAAVLKKSDKVTHSGTLIHGRQAEVVRYRDPEKHRFFTIVTTNAKK